MRVNQVELGLGGGVLWQLADRGGSQMMSYLIETPEHEVIMIDGGRESEGDAMHLYRMLKERGGRVGLWLMTHAHVDHFGALSLLLQTMPDFDIKIDRLCYNFPPAEWFRTVERGEGYPPLCRFLTALGQHGICPETLHAGDRITCGGMSVDILNEPVNYRNYSNVNDTSVCMRVHFPQRDVLFLGDLAVPGGRDLLKCCPPERLRCDIVQMAHHGQYGVERDFYELIRPKICLYTAPDWLWENDNGGGRDSGPWKTLVTRQWMEELGAQAQYACADGDYRFT